MSIRFIEAEAEIRERLKKTKTLLLDFDGTIVDYFENEEKALRALFQELGIENINIAKVIDSYQRINKSLWQRFELGEIDIATIRKERFRMLFHEFGLDFSANIDQLYLQKFVEMVPLSHDNIHAIKEIRYEFPEIDILVVTNGIDDVQKERVQRIGLDKYIDGLITSEGANSTKPDTKIFQIALDHVDGNRETSWMVGDSLTSDIQGAVNAGIKSCLIDSKLEMKYSPNPSMVVTKLPDFLDYFVEINVEE